MGDKWRSLHRPSPPLSTLRILFLHPTALSTLRSPSPTLLEIAEHTKAIQRVGTDSFLEFKDQTKAIRRAGRDAHHLPRLHHRAYVNHLPPWQHVLYPRTISPVFIAYVNHLPSLQEGICSLRSLIKNVCVQNATKSY
ncbi:hypothetical protein CesoFtcFv8_027437 [Champsocephalus esox]|uniref:Uncharacterized protein n=1 Tax=Champsocephalus esox TaxID=159716 RepID=A0AAN7YBV5_9TELE|nr:hypothetical protein CesoFtcFv8_027437 [Champsocephalus esox]